MFGLDHNTLYMLCMVLCVPLGFAHQLLHGATLRRSYSLLVGLGFGALLFGWQLGASLFSSLVTYAICLVVPRHRITMSAFLFNFLFMSACHIYRMATDWGGWSLDFTGPQMILTWKLVSFAVNVYDGMIGDAQKDARARSMALPQMPSVFSFLSYVYFYPGWLAGPFIEYKHYDDFITRAVPAAQKVPMGEFAKAFGGSLVLGGLAQYGIMYYPTSMMGSHTLLFLTSPFQRLILVEIIMLLMRCKYYFAWTLARAGMLAAGFGYDTEKKNWDIARNVYIVNVELAQNADDIVYNWNACTFRFYKHYILKRLLATGVSKDRASLLVFMVSAAWHGFYPGYFVFFVHWYMFGLVLIREINRRVWPRITSVAGQKVYGALAVVGMILIRDYIAGPFVLLHLDDGFMYWTAWKYVGHVITAVMYAAVLCLSVPKKDRKAVPAKKEE